MKIFAISGLGADERVFEYLDLDHEITPILWITPIKRESIVDYSKRLIDTYNLKEESDFGVMGVSFGGLVATEISKLIEPKFTILISSVATKDQLRGFIKFASKSRLIELIPNKLLLPPKAIAHFIFGTDKRELLNSILNDTDSNFAKWAVRELINWNNEIRLPNLIKIGGSKDKMLPPKGEDTILIENGEHFMIVDRATEISQIIDREISKIIDREIKMLSSTCK